MPCRLLGLDPEETATLKSAYGCFWRLQAAARLLTEGPLDPDAVGEGGRRFLLRETGAEDMAGLEQAVDGHAGAAAAIIAAHLPRGQQDGTARDG